MRRSGPMTANFVWAETMVSASHPSLVEPVPDELAPQAQRLAVGVLQPIRDRIARPMRTLSWYRPPALNRQIGGSSTSQHLRAEACDWTTPNLRGAWLAIIELVRDGALPDAGQLIYYPDQRFIHVALRSARFKLPTLCVQWPRMGLRYARHAPTPMSFNLLVPADRDPNTVTEDDGA
jgi:hypothetical protein